jgi:NAD(P)-dependent dehydrogenase (short-subunit alcohol dehydrogenase family)
VVEGANRRSLVSWFVRGNLRVARRHEAYEKAAMDEHPDHEDEAVIERALLSDTAEGRALAARLVELFGGFMADEVRPVLRRIALDGGEPQLTVNALAELLRHTADATEKPIET